MKTFSITNQAHQAFEIPFENEIIEVDLRFLPTVEIWKLNIKYKNKLINGLSASAGVLLLDTYNLPFDLFIDDTLDIGVDPFNLNSFNDGGYTFNIIERAEASNYRGYEVE